jgi:hypothetical protein
VPPHIHHDEDEYSYILEGRIGARIGDELIEAGPGTYVFKPRIVPHTFWNPGPNPARLIEIIAPARFERFFAGLAGLFRSVAPEEFPARRAALGAKYHRISSMAGQKSSRDGSGSSSSANERPALPVI